MVSLGEEHGQDVDNGLNLQYIYIFFFFFDIKTNKICFKKLDKNVDRITRK